MNKEEIARFEGKLCKIVLLPANQPKVMVGKIIWTVREKEVPTSIAINNSNNERWSINIEDILSIEEL